MHCVYVFILWYHVSGVLFRPVVTLSVLLSIVLCHCLTLLLTCFKYSILENVAIKAAGPSAIANLKCFWGPGHQRPNADGFIYIHYVAPSYSARISTICLLSFDKVWLGSVC